MNASDGIYIRTHLMHIDCLLFELLSEAGRMLAIEEDMDRNAFVVQPQALHTVKQLIVRTSYHDELLYSVKSLRLYNKSVSVHVFLYGEHPPGFTQELEEQAVDVHQMGSYVDAIRRIHARAFRTLSVYPVLHKWLNFGELERLAPTQILQADCDTFFFDDVDALFARYSDRHFYAREEPASKASHYGYDPTYLDES